MQEYQLESPPTLEDTSLSMYTDEQQLKQSPSTLLPHPPSLAAPSPQPRQTSSSWPGYDDHHPVYKPSSPPPVTAQTFTGPDVNEVDGNPLRKLFHRGSYSPAAHDIRAVESQRIESIPTHLYGHFVKLHILVLIDGTQYVLSWGGQLKKARSHCAQAAQFTERRTVDPTGQELVRFVYVPREAYLCMDFSHQPPSFTLATEQEFQSQHHLHLQWNYILNTGDSSGIMSVMFVDPQNSGDKYFWYMDQSSDAVTVKKKEDVKGLETAIFRTEPIQGCS